MATRKERILPLASWPCLQRRSFSVPRQTLCPKSGLGSSGANASLTFEAAQARQGRSPTVTFSRGRAVQEIALFVLQIVRKAQPFGRIRVSYPRQSPALLGSAGL